MSRYLCAFEFDGGDLVDVMHALHACPGVHELSFEVLHSIPPPDKTDVDACPPTDSPSRATTIPCPELPVLEAVADMHSGEWDAAVEERVDAALTGAGLEIVQDKSHPEGRLDTPQWDPKRHDELARSLGTHSIWDGCEVSPPIEDVLKCMEEEFDE